MPSLVQGFEYDVFISYRHKDNRYDGWVTEFVANLKKELEATFKEDVSVYFDENPHDGLLETHEVNDSLKSKLKCLIFIPIISQTYCDPKSFAWRHEFQAFRDSAVTDAIGLKVKLANGNVGSRILPVKIHELDSADKQTLESELGGVMRAIDFIYKSSGVNRPLRPKEEEANEAHTVYRNQINKVANSIKELITGLKAEKAGSVVPSVEPVVPGPKTVKPKVKRNLAYISSATLFILIVSYVGFYFFGGKLSMNPPVEKSIAVIPFSNMSDSKEQEYFSDGMTEDILNQLVKISDLKVKSRTSTLQYKATTKSISEIGDELDVAHLVEGSVRRVGNNVRIVVQLIDVKTDVHMWSETYDREMKDVLSIQSEIAIEIANALHAQLTTAERKNIEKEKASDVTAYDYYLKARDILRESNLKREDIEHAFMLVNEALKRDRNFAGAYALNGFIWFQKRMHGTEYKIWKDSSLYYASKAIGLDNRDPYGFVVRGFIRRYLGQMKDANDDFRNAYDVAPNNAEILEPYGYLLLRERNEKGADLILRSIEDQFSASDPEYYLVWDDALFYIGDFELREKILKKSKSMSPGSIWGPWYLANLYHDNFKFDEALVELEQARKINPENQGVIDRFGWVYYLKQDYEKAAKYWSMYKEIESRFDDTTMMVPFRHRLAMAYKKMGKTKEADALVREQMRLTNAIINRTKGVGTWGNRGNAYYDAAVCHAYFGDKQKAIEALDSAVNRYDFWWAWGFENDPAFESLRNEKGFQNVKAAIDDIFKFRQEAFSKAINRLEASNDLKRILK
jgi:TolB-like protein/Tfp pilus assembly protein PilF